MAVVQIKCSGCGMSILRRLRGGEPVDTLCWLCTQEQEVAEPICDLDELDAAEPTEPLSMIPDKPNRSDPFGWTHV